MRSIPRLGFAGLALVLIACGSDSSGPSGGGGPVGGHGVRVGTTLFRSNHNASANPAVDTVTAGTALVWAWVNTGSVSHRVRSTGTPNFTSSVIKAGAGSTYSVTFTTPGTFTYDCAVHGSAMTGRVMVQ